MNEAEVIEVCREAIWVMVKLGGPIMMAALVVGVTISLVQAVTQIQEATVAFVPKILVVFIMGLWLLPLMMSTLITFTNTIAARIVQIGTSDSSR
ncbi:MAG: flagellar biosynthesis protein FliQ [Alphaproteobacteria bacterium]